MDLSECIVDQAAGAGVYTLSCIPVIFASLIGWLFSFAGIAALFFLIFGGFKFITSGGDPKNVEGARKTITYAIVGLVVILSAFLVINTIARITNTPCIKMFGFSNCGSGVSKLFDCPGTPKACPVSERGFRGEPICIDGKWTCTTE